LKFKIDRFSRIKGLKETEEELFKAQLARLDELLEELRRKEMQFASEYDALANAFAVQNRGISTSLAQLWAQRQEIECVREKHSYVCRLRARAEEERKRVLEELLAKRVEVKLMEKLLERLEREYRAELLRIEQRGLDEMGQRRGGFSL